LRPTIPCIAPGECRFIAQAKIQGQSPRNTIVVLEIEADKIRPIVFEFASALLEPKSVADPRAVRKNSRQEQLVCGECRAAEQIIVLRAESEESGLIELVVQINFATLERPAKMNVVLTFLPAHIIGPSEVVSREKRGWVVTEREATLNTDSLNRIRARLERQIHAKC